MLTLAQINNLVDLLAIAVNLGLGAFILIKNRRSEVNQSLGLLIFFVAFWITGTILSQETGSLSWMLFWRRFSSFGSSLLVAALLYFSFVFPQKRRGLSAEQRLLIILPGIFFALTSVFTSLMIREAVVWAEPSGQLLRKFAYGGLYRFATAYYLLYMGLSLYNLFSKFFRSRGREKLQIFYVLFGAGLAGLTGIVTSLVLPLMGYQQYVMLGPPSTLIMAGIITYAIVAHKLLNIEDFLSRGILSLSLAVGVVGTFVIIQMGRASFLLSFYISLFNLALATFVYFQNRKNPINLSFSAVVFIAAAWTFSIGVFLDSKSIANLFLWSHIFYFLGAIIPSILLYFATVFPTEWPPLKRWQKLLIFMPSFVVAPVALFTNWIVTGFSFAATGINAVIGPFYPYFSLYMGLFFGAAFAILIYKYTQAAAGDKMRVRYVLLALVIICVFALIFNVILPWLGNYDLIWVGTYSAIFLTGLTSYAIVKHHLMDISIVISRTVAEILAMVFFGVIYVLMAWGYYAYISSRITLTFISLTLLFGVLLVLAQQKIRFFLQTSADKLFLRGKYDYYNVLTEASSRVAEKLSLASILQILYATFYNAVEVSNPRIFLPEHFAEPERASKSYILYDRQTYLPYERGGRIAVNDPLVKELISQRSPISDRTEQDRLIIPCLLEDRLIAIFMLGPKISEDLYTNEDIRLLQILANQAAMAFDHARSYEKIKADLALAERQLARSERLASLGTLTAGVTHEIRNPLTVVRSETERIANKQRSLDELKQYRQLVLKHVDRIAAIVQRMLAMAKEKPRQETEVDLNECLNAALQLITISRVKLKKDLELVPLIKGDPVEIEEVFVNLLQNAIHAMPDGGTLALRSYIDEGRAVVEISDTGRGIPPELREKIFDPFFSTRHEGVGLGLSIAYRIIREHGGDIRVKSEVGQGTTFKLLF